MKLYTGNLSYEVSDEDLKQAFSAFGQVDSATVVKDTYTRRSKGFGFVEMASGEAAQAAIHALNGKELKGRAMNVSEARPKAEGSGSWQRNSPGAGGNRWRSGGGPGRSY
jgi:RNA recognition motif-containing protein